MITKYLEMIHEDDWTLARIESANHTAFYACLEKWNVEWVFDELTKIRDGHKIQTTS